MTARLQPPKGTDRVAISMFIIVILLLLILLITFILSHVKF